MKNTYYYEVVHINNKETLAQEKMQVKVKDLYTYASDVERELSSFALAANINGLVPVKVVREMTEERALAIQEENEFEHFQKLVAKICRD